MSYSFEVTYYERQMKNYFKGVSGKHIKDTLLITLRNNGSKGWGRYKGYFKCDINQSNYFFEETQIPQDVYPNGALELVLNFPRSEKNSNSGDCFCSIQLVYNDEVYNSQLLRFRKDYDLFGNNLVNEQKLSKDFYKYSQIEKGKNKNINFHYINNNINEPNKNDKNYNELKEDIKIATENIENIINKTEEKGEKITAETKTNSNISILTKIPSLDELKTKYGINLNNKPSSIKEISIEANINKFNKNKDKN